ncbi:MAG: hypothetical protein A2W17_06720 [Planctomycetes bacterium RBG_16_41_13]|nr:MAG: hypothetical protein A2W17_06720 [Planctomycetes bacterium RBG_16_41_13]
MSREIKFRFYDPFNKVMQYCSMEYKDYLSKFFIEYCNALEGENNPVLMQYTGLLDKNGKEIYEGDKCRCRMNGIETHVEEVETEVIYDLTVGAFCHKVISKGSDYKWFGLNSKNLLSCEIIGNIYQTNQIV